MDKLKAKKLKRIRRQKRVRAKVFGNEKRLRLNVFRSNNHIFAQLIDDINATTITGASDIKVTKGTNIEKAKIVGLDIAKKALTKKVKEIVFDRNGYKYHGRVKALAEGAREGGLIF
ncbi:MAG: 50S ribosomal protein L18 [bacterium]